MDATEASMPSGLPITTFLLNERMARRYLGRIRYGTQAWQLLRRLLLGSDGPALRHGSDEFVLDRYDRHIRDS